MSDVSSFARIPGAVAMMRGIHHCRRGEWHNGLHYLRIAGEQPGDVTFPGLYYTYFGLALARCDRRHETALELCEHGVNIGFFDAENFLNLAWVRMLARDRAGALDAIQRGLAVDPGHPALLELWGELGRRQPPVLRFLPRAHPVNRWLGRLRHRSVSRAS